MKVTRIITRILGGILLMVVLTISGCGLLFWVAGSSLCESDIFQETHSPNGKYKVVVFQRDCGATTGFRTHVSVIKSNTELGNQRGNIFQADGHPDWFSIKAVWKDDQHIVIEHNGKPIPDVTKSKVRKVDIQYIENTEGIMPPRPFSPSELLLPASFFPNGWTGEESRFIGPEVIKGSKENNPSMRYTPPPPEKYPTSVHRITKLDNVDQALKYFQQELKVFKKHYSTSCVPSVSLAEELVFKSEYSKNYIVGYAEHKYSDGSGEPNCKMIAQYDEFIIHFNATISENGLTHEQFNALVIIIDQTMTQHLQ